MAVDQGRECPGPERLAEYADGVLAPEARAEIERHLADCADCRHVVAETMAFAEAEAIGGAGSAPVSAARVVPFRSRRWVRGVTAGLAAAALLVVAVRVLRPQWSDRFFGTPGDRPELQELVAALANEPTRPVEGRLTGGFKYAPPPSPTRGPGDREVSPDVRIAAAKIEKRATGQDTAQTQAALGVSYLILGEVQKGVSALEAAVSLAPDRGQYLSDLSAAYLTRATESGSAEDYAKALAFAERALKSTPELLEPQFNRALALEGLHLQNEARNAWSEYLRRDSGSAWAREASRRTERTQGRMNIGRRRRELLTLLDGSNRDAVTTSATRDPSAAREVLEQELLPRWASSRLAHRDAGSPVLERASWLASGIAAQGDRLSADSVRAVRAAVGADTAAADLEAIGHAALDAGRQAYDKFQFDQALELFRSAEAALDRAADPFAEWARLQQAMIAYQHRDFRAAGALLTRIEETGRRHRYFVLLGRAAWVAGLIDVNQARFSSAVEKYERAVAAFTNAGEVENVANVHNMLAEAYRLVGDDRSCWDYQTKALTRLDELSDPKRQEAMLITAALTALQSELPEAALVFQDRYIDVAISTGVGQTIAEGYLQRALIHCQMNDTGACSSDLRDADRWAAAGVDKPIAQFIDARKRVVEAGIRLRQGDWSESKALLTASMHYYRTTHRDVRLPALYLARGRAERSAGVAADARADLDAGMTLMDAQRRALTSEGSRISYLDEAWDLYTEAIDLEITERADPWAALMLAERGRGRSLFESMPAVEEPRDVAALQRLIPDDCVAVYFVTTSDHLLTWVLGRSQRRFAVTRVPVERLRRTVTILRRELEHGDGDAPRRTAADLYNVLVRPVETDIGDAPNVAFIADGFLQRLPFATLFDGERFLIERHTVSVGTNAAIMFRSAQRIRAWLPTQRASALVVSVPFSPGLRRLPDADREAQMVASMYPDAQMLTGARATRDELLRGMARHDVLHFAGHAVANAEYPTLSRLFLAPDVDNPSGFVFARDVMALSNVAIRVAVLAACETGGGRTSRSEGTLSLARPFLAAGVPAVVAGLWDARDRVGPPLFAAFHRALRAGQTPAAALRAGQLALLRGDDAELRRPDRWGVFAAIGGL